MARGILKTSVFCAGLLVVPATVVLAQAFDPGFGEIVAGQLNDAFNSAREVRANMDRFNREIAAGPARTNARSQTS